MNHVAYISTQDARTEVAASATHLVLIPSYNTGAKLAETVRAAHAMWQPVWVVVDGSTDGSVDALDALRAELPGLRVFLLPRNSGKGAAVLHGLRHAAQEGFSHVLTLDADGQHPTGLIPHFISLSRARPDAMILGKPVFDGSAPAIRVGGRKLSNGWAHVETLGLGIGDSLFGFRLYPIAELIAVMEGTRWMRRFDFDPEAAVRLCWRGVEPVNVAAPVRYFTRDEGGVSHFNYLRDNILLSWMHARLFAGFALRFPLVARHRYRVSQRRRKLAPSTRTR